MSPPGPARNPRPQVGDIITINTPQAQSFGTTKVWVMGSGSGSGPATGVICAEGTALSTEDGDPQTVSGKVVSTSTIINPGDPPLADATSGEVNGSNWCIKRGLSGSADIPNAQCGPTAPNRQFVVWVGYLGDGGFIYQNKCVVFEGVSSNDTECGASTTCTDSGSPGRVRRQQGTGTAPAQWTVTLLGLLPGLEAVFNGTWILGLNPGAELRYLWDNGGDGKTRPRVELTCDGLASKEWRLTFSYQGCQVRYTRPAAEWNWLNANHLHLFARESGAVKAPASLTVVPV